MTDRQVIEQLVSVAADAIPGFRAEHLDLAAKYGGTRFENDPSYRRVKSRYESAKAALAAGRALLAEPAVGVPYSDIHRLLLDVLRTTGIDSRSAPEYAIRVAQWLPDPATKDSK